MQDPGARLPGHMRSRPMCMQGGVSRGDRLARWHGQACNGQGRAWLGRTEICVVTGSCERAPERAPPSAAAGLLGGAGVARAGVGASWLADASGEGVCCCASPCDENLDNDLDANVEADLGTDLEPESDACEGELEPASPPTSPTSPTSLTSPSPERLRPPVPLGSSAAAAAHASAAVAAAAAAAGGRRLEQRSAAARLCSSRLCVCSASSSSRLASHALTRAALGGGSAGTSTRRAVGGGGRGGAWRQAHAGGAPSHALASSRAPQPSSQRLCRSVAAK